MTKIFEKSLSFWSHTHPKEAIWLQYLEPKRVKKVGKGKNLKDEKGCFLHEENPFKEAKCFFDSLDLDKVDVVFIYGVGLGVYSIPFKEWLAKKHSRHLIFLEDDLEVIKHLLDSELGAEVLLQPQVSLYYFKDVLESTPLFTHLFWSFPRAEIAISALGYYRKKKADKYQALKAHIHYEFKVKSSLLEEYLQMGFVFYRNYYSNIFHIREAYLGNALFDKFKGIPAIICGAGPSLAKNIAYLKGLKNRAILFAGSSSLNALGLEGIQPHLGAGIDPNPMQEERLKNVENTNFPFLYRNRIYPAALKTIKGPKLYVTGSGGYDISEYFDKEFDIQGKWIEEGRNVINFCLEFAYEMGCNPIIFVGMDLAYTGLREYASGVVQDAQLSKEEMPEEFQISGVWREDIFGNSVPTLWKWVSEAKWIGDFAKMHPEVTLINATEGGIGFPGVPNKNLSFVIAESLTKEYAIEETIASHYLSNSLDCISKQKILNAANTLEKSLMQCVQYLSSLQEENARMKEKIETEEDAIFLQTGKAALIETELASEPAFTYILGIFNDVASKLMQKDMLWLVDPKNSSPLLEKELKKLELNDQKYAFLLNVAKVNLQLLKQALKAIPHGSSQ